MRGTKWLVLFVLFAFFESLFWKMNILNRRCIISGKSRTSNVERILQFEPNDPNASFYNPLSKKKQFSLSQAAAFSVDDFFLTDLVENPEEANKLSPLLKAREDVIIEAQRIHMDIFQSVLKGYRYAMLFDYAPFENKGDSAIAVGELILLRTLKIEIVFACAFSTCKENTLNEAVRISNNYTDTELVILFQGGGNIIGWPAVDSLRANEIPRFMRFNIVVFPLGILYTGTQSHIDFCKKLYASHSRLTFIWRDNESYRLGKKLFPKVRSLLSPDIAFQIGHVPRFMDPTHDILWIKREDKETPNYIIPSLPKGYRVHISDWIQWKTPRGTSSMEDIFLMTTNGMMFLQRGRIVITDRLHGHILSILLGIPHIFIDNPRHKISNYHQTWTAGVENIIKANSSTHALEIAINMLSKLDNALPKVKGFFTHKNHKIK